ncbi:oxygen-dependent tRNA uridine(34) hydroxylase TrhO [Novipirellula artificiosorum]|uniref:tRNA uridine(34) hydroxylase n=1 Tax=Novipirellula artificiosorum TaxID=2528016 RepID=A0A5C6DZD4_9BACT|nr:rhodanese-related sulfurtransferase [Novipirellula artificiosorum]TWU42000.1 putative rhodanese-related sulfurtransferase [Novipirellula artificiosorum]
MPEAKDPAAIVVAALYRFVRLPDFVQLREPLLEQMVAARVRGTLLLAIEGINGTVAGSPEGMEAFIGFLRSDPRLADVDIKQSFCDEIPFRRSRVRLKKEIVTLGVEGIDPNDSVGTYVDAEDWNELIDDPEVVLIDTRNDYEVAIGTFSGATNPQTGSFREFPRFVDEHLDPSKHAKVAMFCTGGIRCEKSTALLKQRGFQKVYHLRGGILKYLEKIPKQASKWNGDCFVFDQRVAVTHGLEVADHVLCFGCGWPVDREAQQHTDFRPGVHCPRCVNELTDEQKKRFAERQRQWELQNREDEVTP